MPRVELCPLSCVLFLDSAVFLQLQLLGVFGRSPFPVAGPVECGVDGIVVTLETASQRVQTSAWENLGASTWVHRGRGRWDSWRRRKRDAKESFLDF